MGWKDPPATRSRRGFPRRRVPAGCWCSAHSAEGCAFRLQGGPGPARKIMHMFVLLPDLRAARPRMPLPDVQAGHVASAVVRPRQQCTAAQPAAGNQGAARAGRKAGPMAGVIDSQRVKSSESAGPCGDDEDNGMCQVPATGSRAVPNRTISPRHPRLTRRFHHPCVRHPRWRRGAPCWEAGAAAPTAGGHTSAGWWCRRAERRPWRPLPLDREAAFLPHLAALNQPWAGPGHATRPQAPATGGPGDSWPSGH